MTQPRLPCFKLGIRFQADDMVKKFLASRRIGFYLAVTREGEVAPFDEITPVTRNAGGVSIADFLRLFLTKQLTKADAAAIHQLYELPSVSDDWKSYFRDRLQNAGIGS